jgi:DNA-directed RNA polymerase specialized sigma24 family protein
LRTALTIISPSLSIEDVASIEYSTELNSVSNLRSEERLGAERDQYGSRRYEIARDICEKLDSETLEIIFQKAFGANQTEIGAILGLTRQTARFRIEEAELRLFEEIKALGLDFEESGGVVSAMLDILGVQFSEVGG